MFPSHLLTFVLLGVVYATPSPSFRMHERRAVAPHGFTAVGPASPDNMLTLRLALTQSDTRGVVDALYRVSDPASAEYGEHLTKAEVSCVIVSDVRSNSTIRWSRWKISWRQRPAPSKLSMCG